MRRANGNDRQSRRHAPPTVGNAAAPGRRPDATGRTKLNASRRNRLAHALSPYLLQHADNPVDWYPWEPEALERAEREDKPVLLSVGYSACHWCHVMAHESFEDAQTAAIMNKHFINVKVDREERPDLDRVYQTAHVLLTGRGGGWPLTVFLTPRDRQPFFCGTYFPAQAYGGLPAFRDLLLQLAALYQGERGVIDRQSAAVRASLDRLGSADSACPAQELCLDPLPKAIEKMERHFDPAYGGFAHAPKFPMATHLQFLLEASVPGEDPASLRRRQEMVLLTLRKMAQGGIFDQIGGGFFRYATDRAWQIPHFEKMLYDNAQLLSLYSKAWQLAPEPLFERAIRHTAAWVTQEMQSAQGGFYSALDADAPSGEEGGSYLWQAGQVQNLLDPHEYRLFARCYGLEQPPNIEGKWHLTLRCEPAQAAVELGLAEAEAGPLLESARRKLLAVRQQRPAHALDDKALSAWNGLIIEGLTEAAWALDEPAWQQAACQTLDFVRDRMWKQGCLYREYRLEEVRQPGYLSDYAMLLGATLSLVQAHWREGDLEFAIALAEQLLEQFEDPHHGGFFFTSHEHERLLYRPRVFTDDVLPCANGLAIRQLYRLGCLLGETRYLEAAQRALQSCYPQLRRDPEAHGTVLLALQEYCLPLQIVVIRARMPELQHWQRACREHDAPNRMVLAIPDTASRLPDALRLHAAQQQPTAYLCIDQSCKPPYVQLQDLLQELAP